MSRSAIDAVMPFTDTFLYDIKAIDETVHIERGYENIVEKLQELGADIRRVEVPGSAISRAI